MKRPPKYEATRWDDPFWQTVRMCVDVLSTKAAKKTGKPLTEAEMFAALDKRNTTASKAFVKHLKQHPDLADRVAEYLHIRIEAVAYMLAHLRTEDEAKTALQEIAANVVIGQYGTQSADHHQSSKVTVATVNWLTEAALANRSVTFEPNPQARAAIFEPGRISVSARRLDGAIPSLLNPAGLWEIKEYWGGSAKQKGGSKMSDAIYECQLVGTELRMYEDKGGSRVLHYLIFDGLNQWQSRPSDLARSFDLLSSGLLDEVIVGDELLTEWPRIVGEMADLFEDRAKGKAMP